jgi:hypothetical protein
MDKSEVRKKQWEISESLFSCLRKGMVLTGEVGDIIECCGSKTTGNAMAKYLERAQTMRNNPFRVNRKRSALHGCMYRITLKEPGPEIVEAH